MAKFSFLSLSAFLLLFACTAGEAGNAANETADSSTVTANTSEDNSDATAQKLGNITMAFAGDIMMGTTFPESPSGAYLPSNGGRDLFKDVAPLLREADVAAANLEGVMMAPGSKPSKDTSKKNCVVFRMPPEYVQHLVDAGFDLIGVANNHVNDFGAAGNASTHRILREAGLAYAGIRESCPTTVIERAGRKIGFAGFGHSPNTLNVNNLDEARRVVGDLKKQCDIVVVSFHGGGEGGGFQHVPHKPEVCFGEKRGDVEAFAHTVIDAGADVVFGHGPHVTRGIDMYKDRLICYSLGNFCTPFRMSLAGVCGHAPVVTMTMDAEGRFVDGKINSFIQQSGVGPRLDKTNSVARVMRDLSKADFPNSPLVIADDGTITRK